MNCKNCNADVHQNYCPNCGQAVQLKRINGKYIRQEIGHLLHFEKGLLYTIRELLLRPGANVRHFISENRSRLVKPILFLIISSLIFTLITHFFHIEDNYMSFTDDKESATKAIFQWTQDHYGYANIIMGIFIAFFIKLFFKKYDYNIYEIIILLCFVMGMGMLFFALFALISGLINCDLMQVSTAIGFIYLTWAIGQFFDKGKAMSYIKAFASYLLGMFAFSLAAVLIGQVVDLIIKR